MDTTKMKSIKLTVELTAREQEIIRQRYARENLSEVIRAYLLGDKAEKRLREKTY